MKGTIPVVIYLYFLFQGTADAKTALNAAKKM